MHLNNKQCKNALYVIGTCEVSFLYDILICVKKVKKVNYNFSKIISVQ